MFYKLKQYKKKEHLGNNLKIKEKSKLMIKNVIESYAIEDKDDEKKLLPDGREVRDYSKKFIEEEFVKFYEYWNEDLIDSLMIFYEYLEALKVWSRYQEEIGGKKNERAKIYGNNRI